MDHRLPEVSLFQEFSVWLTTRKICVENFLLKSFCSDEENTSAVTSTNLTALTLKFCEKSALMSLQSVVQSTHSLVTLVVTDSENVSDEMIVSLIENNLNLKSCDFHNCRKISDESILALCDNCPSLEYLNVSYCFTISDASIVPLAKSCFHLTSLHLAWDGKGVTDRSILALAEHSHVLNTLNVHQCWMVSAGAMELLLRACRQLTDLNIIFCNGLRRDSFLEAIGTHCPQLRALNIFNCNDYTNAGIFAFVDGCKLITALDISFCVKLTMSAVECLVKNLHHLRRVACRQVFSVDNTQAFLLFANKFSFFKSIDYFGVVLEGEPLDEGQRPEALDFTSLESASNIEIQDFAVLSVLHKCSQLTSLSLHCEMSFETVCALVVRLGAHLTVLNCGARSGVMLHKWSCKVTDDAVMGAIAEHCHSLTDFSILGCGNVTDAGLSSVLRSNRKLRKLNCYGCSLISEHILSVLCECNPNLQELETNKFVDLSPSQIERVKRECKQLIRWRSEGSMLTT